jgi:hypothetical protein
MGNLEGVLSDMPYSSNISLVYYSWERLNAHVVVFLMMSIPKMNFA